jgi:hypothetical protein
MNLTTTTHLTLDELRAVIKSLSIGCDQVAKKIARVTDTKWQDGVTEEYALLMSAKHECERALVRAMEEVPNG